MKPDIAAPFVLSDGRHYTVQDVKLVRGCPSCCEVELLEVGSQAFVSFRVCLPAEVEASEAVLLAHARRRIRDWLRLNRQSRGVCDGAWPVELQ